MKKEHRYILCRPVGGLNDSLNQIEMCWQYAEATGRTLLIDGMYSGMLDRLDRYFEIQKKQRLQPVFYYPSMAELLNRLTCLPKCVAGKINSYTAIGSANNCIDAITGDPLNFDLAHHHQEELLVHHQYGGGTLSYSAIARIQLVTAIAQRIIELKKSHTSYIAVHIRNTDYQTDYEPVFQALRAHAHHRQILVCTDDLRCKRRALEVFGEDLFSATTTPDTAGHSIHANPNLNRWEENCNSLVDLAMLASADQLFITKTTSGLYSGFSMLANHLNHNRTVLYSFLG
jgi:hypothetical protein